MSISGHVTLREVERYTKAANRAKLADSAIASPAIGAKATLPRSQKVTRDWLTPLVTLANSHCKHLISRKNKRMAGVTGLEPAASGVTGRRSNQLSYTPTRAGERKRIAISST